MQGVWVWSMDWELSSQMPQYVAKNLKRKILFFCWFGKLDWCHTLFLNHPGPPQCMGQGGHHCEMLGWCSVPTDGCCWLPLKSKEKLLPNSEAPWGSLSSFLRGSRFWIRSVELEGRILKFPLVEEPKMEQSTSVPPNGTFRQGLGKWTVSCAWKQSLWEFLVRNFKILRVLKDRKKLPEGGPVWVGEAEEACCSLPRFPSSRSVALCVNKRERLCHF